MLGFLGDIHGAAGVLEAAAHLAAEANCAALIQVGDCGFRPERQAFYSIHLPLPVYWIPGNHEAWEFSALRVLEPTEFRPNMTFVPNGCALTIDGKRIGFMGGGDSVDKAYNSGWNQLEVPTPEDWERLLQAKHVDLLITHSPGQRAIEATTSREGLRMFGLSTAWTSPVAVMLDYVREQLGNPQMFCGHMHYSANFDGVRILDIGELYCV